LKLGAAVDRCPLQECLYPWGLGASPEWWTAS